MPAYLDIAARDLTSYKKGDIVGIAIEGKECSQDPSGAFICLIISDATREQVHHYINDWSIDFQHTLLNENVNGWRFLIEVDPIYISASDVGKSELKSGMRDHVEQTEVINLVGDYWVDNSPEDGSVSWSTHTLRFNDVDYSITGNITDKRYIYWDLNDAPTAYHATDTKPILDDESFVIAINYTGLVSLQWKRLYWEGSQVVNFTASSMTVDIPKNGIYQTESGLNDIDYLKLLKSDFRDIFRVRLNVRRYHFSEADVDQVIAAGGTITLTKVQTLNKVLDKLES